MLNKFYIKMPSLEKKIIEDILNKKSYKYFIETGTNNGDTITCMSNLFEKLYTIELSSKLFNLCKKRYKKKYPNIEFIFGDSSNVLVSLCPKIKDNSIFFLDGHYSGGNTAKGLKDCPLYEESEAIYKYFQNEALIIIDDYRLFGKDKTSGLLQEDWSEINKEKILEIFKERVVEYYFLPSTLQHNDRFIINISEKK